MTKHARAVIGANFGDEGKGLLTDYLCATHGASMVVRFNGGAQAGHTVVTPGGRRHVFHHVGAGAFVNVPTFLSQYFVLNPILFFQELDALRALGVEPRVYAHPDCLVTTFADMIINQRLEDARGAARHGSCGVGVNETWERARAAPHLTITASDLWNGAELRPRLTELAGRYAAFRTGSAIPNAEPMVEAFARGAAAFANAVEPAGIAACGDTPVFEGAQGLLLDQENKTFFPHVTRSRTGLNNVRALCAQAGIDKLYTYYVSRTYLTRHGAGPLPGEDPRLSFRDDTNTPHPYQGALRFAPLNHEELLARCCADAVSGAEYNDFGIVYTHCDQFPPPGKRSSSKLVGFARGRTRNDVEANDAGCYSADGTERDDVHLIL